MVLIDSVLLGLGYPSPVLAKFLKKAKIPLRQWQTNHVTLHSSKFRVHNTTKMTIHVCRQGIII